MTAVSVGGSPIQLANETPVHEAAGACGVNNDAARGDHQHPRISSAVRVALDGTGRATVSYGRTFPTKPAVLLTAVNPGARQIALEVESDILAGGNYTGCVIKGWKAQPLPSLTGIALVTGLVSALSNFDPFGGSAAGIEVSVLAILQLIA